MLIGLTKKITGWVNHFTNKIVDADTKPLVHENDMLVSGGVLFVVFVFAESLVGTLNGLITQATLSALMMNWAYQFQTFPNRRMMEILCLSWYFILIFSKHLLDYIVVGASVVSVPLLGIPLGFKYARWTNRLEQGSIRRHNKRLLSMSDWTFKANFGKPYVLYYDLFPNQDETLDLGINALKTRAEDNPQVVKYYWTKLFSIIHDKYSISELLGFQSDLKLKADTQIVHLCQSFVHLGHKIVQSKTLLLTSFGRRSALC